jgi:hypothetical protein
MKPPRFSVRRLASPAVVFLLASIFVGGPGILRLIAPSPPPRMELHAGAAPGPEPPRPRSGTAIVLQSHVEATRSFTAAGPFGAVIFGSMPLFALVYAWWPRSRRPALRPDLGRRHAAFAILPVMLAPAVGLMLMLGWSVIFSAAASRMPDVIPNLLTLPTSLFAALPFVVSGLWLIGLGIFAANVRETLRASEAAAE